MFKLNSFSPQLFFDVNDGAGAAPDLDTYDSLFSEIEAEQNTEEEPPVTIDLGETQEDEEEVAEIEPEVKLEEKEEIDLEAEVELKNVPRKKEILAAFPELFKKFPGIESAIYRDRQFSEVFPTPKDAIEASEKAQAYENISEQLMTGSAHSIFAGVKDEDPEAFNRVVDNLLPDLYKTDQTAYFHVTGSIVSDCIGKMIKYAKAQDNEAVGMAAQVLNQFVFGTNEYVPAQKLAKNLQQDDSVAKEREQFARERFDTISGEFVQKTENLIRSGIVKAIDPKQQMTDYVRDIAVDKAFKEAEKLVSEDKAFTKVIQSMWRRAITNNYDRSAMDKIKSTYLSRVSQILPAVVKKHRNEAFKGMGKYVRPSTDRKGPIRAGKSATQNPSGKINAKQEASKIPSGMSTADYLLSD